ncbi:MAG: methyltransferase domain-containing protein [Planctomycetes bacterium]|nr:methyltransferase domain-containing protein [Planctomycetota bacterium]
MKKLDIGLPQVNEVYAGPEGVLWELIMGEQIHAGGFQSSMALAKAAGIQKGWKVLDLCSALGGGVRFLVRNFGVQGFGLDGTKKMVDEAVRRTKEQGLKAEYKLGDVQKIPWPDGTFDAVWGEDAWCYVADKNQLVKEAHRVLKKGGTIAFTDWIEGPKGLSDAEAERINKFMKFPYMESLNGYKALLEKTGFAVSEASDHTPEFAGYIDLYLKMLTEQLTTDALRIIGFNMEMFQAMGGEMTFMDTCAHEGKFGWGRFVAKKK